MMELVKNILITGANGQLGSEFNRLYKDYPSFLFFSTDVDTLDLTDKQAISDFITQHDIRYIVNCAAYTAVDKAEDDVDCCYKINRDAVKNLAEAAYGKARIIHVSTDYVFDGKGNRPYSENDATSPQSVYGNSKREGELTLLQNCPESIIVRTAWLYSVYGNNFVKTMIRLGKERPELKVVADQTGTPTYAADLAQAILSIIVYAEKHNTFPSGIYHYSNEGVTSWFEFTKKIHQFAGIYTCEVHPITSEQYPTRATRPMYSVLDKTKIKERFGIVIPAWEESLERCIRLL